MTVYTFDLVSRRIGTMAYPDPVDALLDCVALLNHADETSGTTAVSAIGPNLTVAGPGELSADALCWGTGGFKATGGGDVSLTGSGASVLLTSRYIDYEAWFRLRAGGSDADTLDVLGFTDAGSGAVFKLSLAGAGGAPVFRAGGSNVTVPSIAFTVGVPTHIAVSYNPFTGFAQIWQDGTRKLNFNVSAGNYSGVTLAQYLLLVFDTSAGRTCAMEVDEIRCTICAEQARYDGATIPVPTAPFPGP